MQLRGRVALVTGAGRRVGQALAIALGREGANVGVHFSGSERGARETAAQIERAGGKARTFQADLTSAKASGELVAAVVSHFGGLNVLVNSAAVMLGTPFGEITSDQWDSILALNLKAPFFLAQEAAPYIRKGSGGGSIVNIADLAAFETWPDYLPHGISKSGVVHMTKALARVLAPDIRVNAIAPGTVLLPDDWTERDAERLDRTTPLKRQGSPTDVVQAMLYLLSADYVTGETIIVDGGRHVRT
jgi:pteridine reductase